MALIAVEAHPLSQGISAAMALETMDLQRDEASLTRLAGLISDLGALAASDQVPASKAGAGLDQEREIPEASARCAHPMACIATAVSRLVPEGAP